MARIIKVRLKNAIAEFGRTLYEVRLNVPRQEEEEEQAITKRPRRPGGKAGEVQKALRQRFKQAGAYAQAAMADPGVRARYAAMARQQGKRLWG